jgi:hypothetical protein
MRLVAGIDEIAADTTRVRSGGWAARADVVDSVNESGNEVPALVHEPDFKRLADLSSRNVDGLPSSLLLGNRVAAVADSIDGDLLGGFQSHPHRTGVTLIFSSKLITTLETN